MQVIILHIKEGTHHMSREVVQALFIYLCVIILCAVVAFCTYGNGQNEEVHYSCFYQGIYELLFDVQILK